LTHRFTAWQQWPMPVSVKKKQAGEAPALAVGSVSRKPMQGRSKASLERMLAAARDLMIERGSEEFTLQEVSQRGNVSIGSIYLRFESKDNLVRAVIANALEEIGRDEKAMIDRLAACRTLDEFVPRFVESYAEVLRINAPLLRLCMQRAAYDPLVSRPRQEARIPGRGYVPRCGAALCHRNRWRRHAPARDIGLSHHLRHAGAPAQPRFKRRIGA
jgi:AcrR family transcriptional regulator